MSFAAAPAVTAQPLRPARRFYRPELDVLRFFAFFGVFLFHAAPRNPEFYSSLGWPPAAGTLMISILGTGAYGVDLFFALSSYLITSLLLRERDLTGKLDLPGFYLRRILRIWPLYLSFVAFAAVVARLSHTQHLGFDYVAAYTLLAGNWIYVFRGMPVSFATPLWTVSIEEQFYLAWPLACRTASRRGIIKVALSLLVLANLSRIVLAYASASIQALEFNTFSRIDPIALGSIFAVLADKAPNFARPMRWLLVAGGLLTWIAASAYTGAGMVGRPVNPWSLVLVRPWISLASLVILLGILGSRQSVFSYQPLVYLGKISYGLYVIHEFGRFLAAYFIHARGPASLVAQGGLALAFTLALAAISYRCLETPFLRLKDRFSHVASRPV